MKWLGPKSRALYYGLVIALLVGCSRSASQTSDAPPRTNMSSQCVGRFRLEVPDSLAVVGRNQSIYRVEVSTGPVPPAGAKADWDERLAAIRKMPAPAGRENAIVRSFDLASGVSAVWYSNNPASPGDTTLEAAQRVNDHLLRVLRQSEVGREGPAETLVRDVMAAYLPGVTNYGFCLGSGTIAMETAQNERANIAFEDHVGAGLEIRIETNTVAVPDTDGYSDLDEERSFAKASGASLTVLREQERTVAGLVGIEIGILIASPEEGPMVRFTWHFPGVALNGTHPKINIIGAAKSAQRPELENIWETILQSLRPLPVFKQ